MIELLIVVAIIGILSVVGIPIFNNVLDGTRAKSAQTGLESILLAEEEYKSINKNYYIPSGSCGDQTNVINTNLFDGDIILKNDHFRFCITGSNSLFTATAYNKKTGGTDYYIKNTKEKNY